MSGSGPKIACLFGNGGNTAYRRVPPVAYRPSTARTVAMMPVLTAAGS